MQLGTGADQGTKTWLDHGEEAGMEISREAGRQQYDSWSKMASQPMLNILFVLKWDL
jgi:hypothetical protein